MTAITNDKPSRFWTEADIQFVKRGWAQGLTAAEMARKLGKSRSSVLGLSFRQGFSRRRPGKRATAPRIHTRSQRAPVAAKNQAGATSSRPAPADPAPINLDLVQLSDRTCRYAVTAALPHLFCGHPVVPGRVWCAAHHARVVAKEPAWRH